MADTTALKNRIRAAIKANDNQEITGPVLQQALLDMVDELNGETEASARQSGDNTLQQNLNTETQQRQSGDNTLQQNLNTETQQRQEADTQLNNLITGIKNNIDNGYVYAGIATPSTTPASGKVFYLALTAGTYTNFGATVVPQGINILKYNGSAWSLDSFLGLDDAPTPNSLKLVKSGGAFDSIIKDGSAFDLSAYNNGTTYVDLSAALTALNALPAVYKKGGMSVKYVQTYDNKYVQYRLMSDTFSITESDWQGVDDEPTAGSNNLVKSGGTHNRISSVEANIGKYDITPTTTGYFNILPRPLLQKGSVIYIYIEDDAVVSDTIDVEYINAQTGVYIGNICSFTNSSEKLYRFVVNRDNVSFRIKFRGSLVPIHIRCNISGNVKEYTDVTIPNTEFLLKEDTLFKEIVKNDIRTNIIYNNDFSLLNGGKSFTITKNLKSSTRYYFYVGGNKECGELSRLLIRLKNSNDTVILYRDVINDYNNRNHFLIEGTVFYEFFVDIVEDGDYTLSVEKYGNAITLNAVITENIPLPHYITDKIYSHLQNTTGDYSFGLRWYNATTDGANKLAYREDRITSYFQDRGTFKIEYDDSNYQLYCRKDSGSSDEVSNGSIITFSEENIVSFSIKNKNTTQRPIIEDVKLIITKINVNKNEVPLQLENGSFDGAGNNVDNVTKTIRTQKIYCDGKSLVIAICPDSMKIQCNLETDNITRKNLQYHINAGVSVSYPIGFIRFSFLRNDGSVLNIDNLTEAERSGIHVYAIEGQTDGKISLAAYNSPDYIKDKADFVCTDANAQYILNACLSCIGSLNIMLYRGNYNLYKLFSDRFGKKCALKTQDALFGVIGKIKLEGESNRVSNIFMTEDCFNLYDSNIKGSLISVPCRNEDGVSIYPLSDTYITIKDIDIKCYDYTKPIVGLDVVFSQETKITDVNYRADGYNSRGGLPAFRTKPHVGCIGIRVGYGSNNGVCNFVKHCRIFYCYKGISCAGEHYIFEDVLTHHCYIGWAFGDYNTTGHFEHPNVMIGCSIEGCYRLMYLTKGGITIEGEFTPNYDDNVNLTYSTLVCIGLSTEDAWPVPLDERVEGEPTEQVTLPILEVLKGAYRGRIEMDFNGVYDVFENGSGRAMTWRKYAGGTTVIGHGNTVDETYG